MNNDQINKQIASLNTSDAAAVKAVSDAINASSLSSSEKAAAHAEVDSKVASLKGNTDPNPHPRTR